MSIREAAEALGVSRMHIRRLVQRGELTLYRNPAYRKGGPVQIPREQVEALQRQIRDSRPDYRV